MNNSMRLKIREFCLQHSNVYLYGAGRRGAVYYNILKELGFSPKGILTTHGDGSLNGIKCEVAQSIDWNNNNDIGVILAVTENTQNEILESSTIKCDVLALNEYEYEILISEYYVSILQELYSNYPPITTEKDAIKEDTINSILIIQLEVTFGDMIWSTAFLRELRSNHMSSSITILINEKYVSLFEHCPFIDRIIPYDCSSLQEIISKDMVKRARTLCGNLLNEKYDILFLPRHIPLSLSDAWENILIALMCKAKYRIAHGIGITRAGIYRCEMIGQFFSKLVVHTCGEHEVEYDLDLIRAVGGVVSDERMEVWLSKDSYNTVRPLLQDKTKCYISVALVGSEEKRSLSPEKYNTIFRKLIEKYGDLIRFVLCGGEDSIEAAEISKNGIEGSCIDLTNRTSLLSAAAAINMCCFYVGSDTGLMHFASALGKPVIEISASIQDAPDYWGCSPTRTGPWRVPNIVLRPPAGLDGCRYMCSMKFRHCIEQINVYQVVRAVSYMIETFYMRNDYI